MTGISLLGSRFGHLTVLREWYDPKKGCMCLCQCDCGQQKTVYRSNLRKGKTKSCGCLMAENQHRYKDITGKVFGQLTALQPTAQRMDGSVVWTCRCACGKLSQVSIRNLERGFTKSCGCLQKTRREPPSIANRRFGRLVALSVDPQGDGKRWLCQCDCGTLCSVCRKRLLSGHTRSCGCLKRKEYRTMVEGTCLELLSSAKIPINNRSGTKGVSYDARSGKWIATLVLAKRHYYLGQSPSIAEASLKRRTAEIALVQPILARYNRLQGRQDAPPTASATHPADQAPGMEDRPAQQEPPISG